jgi:predicted dehydrogenase
MPTSSSVSRRSFMTMATGAASAMRVVGANDRVRLGIVGTGGRGKYLMGEANRGNIEWVGVCDVWKTRQAEAQKIAARKNNQPAAFTDYRELLDRKDIDAVIVATTDHNHVQVALDACKAGKDIYVEKPMSSVPAQGAPLVKAVRDSGRVLQTGVQQRSMRHFIEAKQRFFDSGLIGRVNMVRTIWNGNSGYLESPPPGMERKPDDLDWDRWLGWLPKRPWDPKMYFNRFAYWDVSSGAQTGGLFVHQVDVVHWYLNLTKADSAVASGGIFAYDDGRDAPDNINLILKYPQKVLVTFEATLGVPEEADIVFSGTGGTLSIFRSRYRFRPSGANRAAGEIVVDGARDEGAHMDNWLDCIRTRKDPNATVEHGHRGAMACHIAYKQQTQVAWRKEWDL